MRNAFAQVLTALAAENPRLVLLTGDIGNRLFDSFKTMYPSRFYNCGVAEAGMTGIAAGLASSGMQPVTYTIAPFNTLRCLEQIRNDICYPDLPVVMVGTGAGLSYAELGPSHHSMEDIGVLRTIPNIHIVAPGDPVEVRLAIIDALRLKKPVYIRLGKKGEPVLYPSEPEFEIGKWIYLKEGTNVAILGVGNMLGPAMECSDLLKAEGISCTVVSMHTIKPLDDIMLKKLFNSFDIVAVAEEHGFACGACSAVIEWGISHGVDIGKLSAFASPDRFMVSCGKQQLARREIGLTPENMAKLILRARKKRCL